MLATNPIYGWTQFGCLVGSSFLKHFSNIILWSSASRVESWIIHNVNKPRVMITKWQVLGCVLFHLLCGINEIWSLLVRRWLASPIHTQSCTITGTEIKINENSVCDSVISRRGVSKSGKRDIFREIKSAPLITH